MKTAASPDVLIHVCIVRVIMCVCLAIYYALHVYIQLHVYIYANFAYSYVDELRFMLLLEGYVNFDCCICKIILGLYEILQK